MKIEMKNISKQFGATKALSDVSFTVEEGEIHGLLGENGAGKSTLMNILAGIFPPSSGEIYIDGALVPHMTSRLASNHGIEFIHQELSLVNDLRVYENIFLGREVLSGAFRLDKKAMISRTSEILQEMQLSIDPTELVANLDTSSKQLVEIARCLLNECRLIIMDEPTTALSSREIENLFTIMRGLKAKKVSLIYISHKMPELFEICDRYTVFRDGKFIQSGYFRDINEAMATRLLVGKDISERVSKENCAGGQVALSVKSLSCAGFFEDVSFELHEGEIIAITGLHGDGRGELAEALFGARRVTSGEFRIKGSMPGGIKQAMKLGIGMVPRNRKERSIIKDMSIMDNLFISKLARDKGGFFINKKRQAEEYEVQRSNAGIKAAGASSGITSLSGGNQQKVIISRWLLVDSDVYILDNPTQGLDVGSKFEIYEMIRELARQGKGILLFSAEFPEIQQVADKCLVMYKGGVRAELSRDELDELKVMYYATGGKNEP